MIWVDQFTFTKLVQSGYAIQGLASVLVIGCFNRNVTLLVTLPVSEDLNLIKKNIKTNRFYNFNMVLNTYYWFLVVGDNQIFSCL